MTIDSTATTSSTGVAITPRAKIAAWTVMIHTSGRSATCQSWSLVRYFAVLRRCVKAPKRRNAAQFFDRIRFGHDAPSHGALCQVSARRGAPVRESCQRMLRPAILICGGVSGEGGEVTTRNRGKDHAS